MTQQRRKRRLAVFDVEGVVIPKKRYLFFEVGRTLGLSQFLRIIFFGFLYEAGLISLKKALKHLFKSFRGIRVEELLRIFRQVPLMASTEETFEGLRNEGWKTALISSGLPTVVVQDLAKTLKADYAFGFELGMCNEALTGEISGDVIERGGKLPVLMKILESEELAPRDCVVIADDRNNASVFLPEILKIGYYPDFEIRIRADDVVTGSLLEILRPMRGEPKQRTAKLSRNNVVREIIHASGFFVPIFASMLGPSLVALFIFVVTLLYVMSELARIERKNLPIISSLTRHVATQPELYEFATAPIFFALGILLTLLLFPSPANGAAIAIFALGDSAASIFGKAYGQKMLPLNKGKTLEGSLAGFMFALLAGMYFISPFRALLGALVAMTVEGLPLPLNDNLVTPLITGMALTLSM